MSELGECQILPDSECYGRGDHAGCREHVSTETSAANRLEEALRELHQPEKFSRLVPVFDQFDFPWQHGTECRTCRNGYWPCETVKALDGSEQR